MLVKIWGVFLVCSALGCGPVVSGVRIVQADAALKTAQASQAEKSAAYEFVTAQQYLQAAREANAYAKYWMAREYAAKALQYAKLAQQKVSEQAAAEAVDRREQFMTLETSKAESIGP